MADDTDTARAAQPKGGPRRMKGGMNRTMVVLSGDDRMRAAMRDLGAAFAAWRIWGILGIVDTQTRYRRTALGPFWITLSLAIQALAIGGIFAGLFGVSFYDYLPYVAIGLVVWQYMLNTVNETANSFDLAKTLVRNMPLPLAVHVLRAIWRNVLSMLHHLIFIAAIAAFTAIEIAPVALLAIPGLFLVVLNLTWIGLILALVSVRFRDVPFMVMSVMQVLFFVTPVIWSPERLDTMLHFLTWNPAYHLIELVRTPLLGAVPSTLSVAVAIGSAVVGWIAALAIYGRYQWRVAYWV